MNCEDISALLGQADDGARRLRDPAVERHLKTCADCRHAMRAVRVLRGERDADGGPRPRPGAFERTMRAVTGSAGRAQTERSGFLKGLTLGALGTAVPAAVTLWFALSAPESQPLPPEVAMVVHEVREIGIGIDAAEPMTGAEIQVTLRGAIDLRGFDGMRDLRWQADLLPGINELALPIVATGTGGGQVIVEIRHGAKRRAFLFEVTAGLEDDAA